MQSKLDPVMHLKFENTEAPVLLSIERTDHSFLDRLSHMQILEAPASSLETFDFIYRDPRDQLPPASLETETATLSEGHLRLFSHSAQSASQLKDGSSQYVITENNSTIVIEDAVAENPRESRCSSEPEAMDLNGLKFLQQCSTLWSSGCQFDDNLGSGGCFADLNEDLLLT
jgi:hypothetical protein